MATTTDYADFSDYTKRKDNCKVGLLLNFAEQSLKYKRLVK